jgi:hypothetical protein
MANLKDISEGPLLASIERAKDQATAEIERAAESAREQVRQAVALSRSDLPGLLQVVQGTDLAFVTEIKIGDWQNEKVQQSFILQTSAGGYTQLGDAVVKSGRYRILLFGVRVDDPSVK